VKKIILSTLHCPAIVLMLHWIYFGKSVTLAIFTMIISAANLLMFFSSQLCVLAKKPQLPEYRTTTPGSCCPDGFW
jgi:hypothetical protein